MKKKKSKIDWDIYMALFSTYKVLSKYISIFVKPKINDKKQIL